MLSTNMPWSSLRLDFASAVRSLREGHTRSHEETGFTFKRSINRKEPYVSKIYAVYLFLCKIPSQLMHFCHCCWSLKRVACDRTAFQQFIMMDSFLDCFTGCIVLPLHLIVVWTWTDGSQMEPSLDCWVDGGEVASRYSESLHTQISSDGPYVFTFRMIFCPPFPRIFVMPCTVKLLQLLKMMSTIDTCDKTRPVGILQNSLGYCCTLVTFDVFSAQHLIFPVK